MDKPKHQVIFIRGGDTFAHKENFLKALSKMTYRPDSKRKYWTDWLEWSLTETFDSFSPIMPCKQWSDYDAWLIWFEKVLEYINPDKSIKLILIGNSLGCPFLLKYLSENKLKKNVDQLHLVASMCNDLPHIGEQITNFRPDLGKLSIVEKKVDKIFMYHSSDDKVVPIEQAYQIKKYLPNAKFFEFTDRGHFPQPTFIEILDTINKNL